MLAAVLSKCVLAVRCRVSFLLCAPLSDCFGKGVRRHQRQRGIGSHTGRAGLPEFKSQLHHVPARSLTLLCSSTSPCKTDLKIVPRILC